MTVWFTSDTHFGHDNIIRHCKRPWNNSIEMDADLIKIWNKVVHPDDEVWHLGDWSFHRNDWRNDAEIRAQLNGRIHIIAGNHDNAGFLRKCGFASVHEGIVNQHFKLGSVHCPMVLAHYPLREWDGFYYGAYHLFGHVHATLPGYCRSMDVGVDTNDYIPYSLEQVVNKLNSAENKHQDRLV